MHHFFYPAARIDFFLCVCEFFFLLFVVEQVPQGAPEQVPQGAPAPAPNQMADVPQPPRVHPVQQGQGQPIVRPPGVRPMAWAPGVQQPIPHPQVPQPQVAQPPQAHQGARMPPSGRRTGLSLLRPGRHREAGGIHGQSATPAQDERGEQPGSHQPGADELVRQKFMLQ